VNTRRDGYIDERRMYTADFGQPRDSRVPARWKGGGLMKNWKELSVEERRRLVDQLGWAQLREHQVYGSQITAERKASRQWVNEVVDR